MAFQTVPVNDRISGPYVASLGQTSFGFDFPAYQSSEIVVTRERAGISVQLALNFDYSLVINVDGTGGSVTLLSGASAADRITILGQTSTGRETSFDPRGEFLATEVNRQLNRLHMLAQELARDFGGSVRGAPGEALPALPPAAARALRVLGFDVAGNPSLVGPPDALAATLPLLNIATLRAAVWPTGRPAQVYLTNNWVAGDGGGIFRWDATSVAADNGGSIIKETATAIGRWIENSGNVFVTLEQFGGGIAKTAAQNNAAFTLARAAGGIIRLGSGEYSISSRLTLQSGTTILGDPSRTSAIKLTNTTDHVILVADGADNIYLDQFTVRGSYASGARNDFHGVGFENTDTGQTHSNIVLSNLSAENISGDGFYLSAMRGVTCLGVMKATNCRFGFAAFKDVFDLFAEAIEVYGCSRAGVLFDCDTATDTAPTVRPNARVRIGSLLAERCALETGGHAGVLISGTSQVHIDRITVRNHGSVPGNPTAAVGALGDAVVVNSGNLSTANSAVQISVGFIEAYDVSGGGALWVNDAREVWIGGGRYSNIWLWPSQLFASAVRITSTGAGLTNNIHIGPMQSLRPSPPGGYFNGPHDHLQLGTNVTAVFQAFPQGSVANSRRYDPTNTAGNLTIAAVTAL